MSNQNAVATTTGGLDSSKVVVLKPGDDIQAAVNQHAEGTTFILSAGIYSNVTITPKDNQSFIGQNGAILSGATTVSGWTLSHGVWSASGFPNDTRTTGEGRNGLSGYPNDLVVNGTAYTRVGSLADLKSGTFYSDGKGHVSISDDPTHKVTQVTTTENAFVGGTSTGVTIKNLVVQNYAPWAQEGAIQAHDTNGWKLIDVTATGNHGAGVEAGSNMQIIGGTYSNNGEVGIHASSTTGLVINGVTASGNNYAGYSDTWDAGGIKILSSTNAVVENSTINNNNGVGLWFDWDNKGVTINNNSISNNKDQGVMIEASYNTKIYSNTISYNNTNHYTDGYWGSDLLVTDSSYVDIEGNKVISDVGQGIGMMQNLRGAGAYGGHYSFGNTVSGNTIVMLTPGLNGFSSDGVAGTYGNNTWNNNTYISNAATSLWFTWNGQNFWAADRTNLPIDKNSQFLYSNDPLSLIKSIASTMPVEAKLMTVAVGNAADGTQTMSVSSDGTFSLTHSVTGQIYALERSVYTAAGALVEVDRTTAAGVLVSKQVVTAAGTVTDTYGASGQKASESVVNADGSKTYTSYGVQGQTYASDHLVTNAAGQLVEEDQYAASGALLMKKVIAAAATTLDHYNGAGVLTQESVTHADGSRQVSNFAIAGQGYASDYTSTNAAGAVVEYDQYAADKTLLLKSVTNAAGTTTSHYGATGVLLNEGVVHADGSKDYTNYAVTGQSYAREHMLTNAAGKVVEDDQYAASGVLLAKVVVDASGTTTDRYSASGALTSENIVHADGTRDATNYAVQGQSYAREHVAYAAGGAVVEVDRSAADGTLLYKQTVSAAGSTTDTYSASGAHLTQAVVNADHSKDAWTFAAGSGSAEHDSYGSNGALLLVDVANADGSHKVNAYAGGLTLASHAGVADTFQSYGNDTFVFAAGSGADAINKFHAGGGAGHDTIQINVPGITSFAQLQALMSATDHGGDTTIHLGAADSLVLHQVAPSALSAANFQFVHHDALVG